jgi:predicted metal-binding protein
MKKLQSIVDALFDNTKLVASSKVPFNAEVIKSCEQNMCGFYGRCWTCPPAVEEPEILQKRLHKYNTAFIINKVYQLEDSFDWEGMQNGAKNFQINILEVKQALQDSYPKLDCVVLGAGSCSICETCNYQDQEPCRNPELAITSVEACGVDVMKMLKDNGLQYNNGPNTVTYVGTLFFNHP